MSNSISEEVIHPSNETELIRKTNQNNASYAKQAIHRNSRKTATADDQVNPMSKQIDCSSSQTATADDQVTPLPKQTDHLLTNSYKEKKDTFIPFIICGGWSIKGKNVFFPCKHKEQSEPLKTGYDEKSTKTTTLVRF